MKTRILYRMTMIAAISGIIYACNKSSSGSTTPGQSTANLQTQSDDQVRIDNENEAIFNDVNATLASPGASTTTGAGYIQEKITTGAKPISSLICDASVTLDSIGRTITITYNGSTDCPGTRIRTGIVVITLPANGHWRDTGAVITVSIQNLKITRIKDGKAITLNGTHVYTNVSGGRLIDLPKIGNITHTVTADSMNITFDDGTQRYWSVARKRVYALNNGVVTITTTGMHSDGSNTGISEWGSTRFGNKFETIITQPLTLSSDCYFRLTSGAVEILRPDITTNVTFGLDSTGKATSCPGLAPYYFQATWQASGGKSGSVIWPY